MDALSQKVKSIVELCVGDKSVCVAVSGGSDSMCLLDCLLRHELIEKSKLSVVNVDHCIRGEESERDSEFVRGYCEERGLRLTFRRADIPTLAAESGRSTETEARVFRRALFDEIIACGGADLIMTAHNADDRTETLLMHIFRGCGLGGLIGMTMRDGRIVRPLIGCGKSEILAYNREHNVPYVEDSTNADEKYTRNFIRHSVLPLIKTRYPRVENALERLSYAAECETDMSGDDSEREGDSIKISFPLYGRKIRAAFIAAGLTADFTAEHIAAVESLERVGAGIDLPHGYRAEMETDCVRVFAKSDELIAEAPFTVGNVDFGNVRVSVTECTPAVIKTATAIDLGKVPKNAVIRTRREGDRFRPIGGGEKSLSDWLIDKKIPRYERRRLLYVASGAEVLCVIGRATGEKLKIDDKTAKAALVCATRAGEDI